MDSLVHVGLSLKLSDLNAHLINHRCHIGLHAFGFGGLHDLCQMLLLGGQDILHLFDLLGLTKISLVDRCL